MVAHSILSSKTLSRGGQILPGELYKVTLKSISGDKQVYMHIKIILQLIAMIISSAIYRVFFLTGPPCQPLKQFSELVLPKND